ncbi:uncharacterized protein [Aegilops tauschii subsp. strangulata]|uniref:uncharacterized protein n=1 Tax=Aegilops tauschii subsp. strangulata TaxID=200361 RepID=UPI003CC85E71
MAGILWASFKSRMGQAQGINMGFDLNHLIQPIPGLEELSLPFSDEEINRVLKELPVDRAPGLDGFNGMFAKRCWPIIETDFLRMIQDFYEGKLSLENINASLITLIPKIISPEGPDDFRPISLTNTCLKFLTKSLANQLQRVILKCIHKNQYGFLKGSSSVLLNGIPGKQFKCKCGLRNELVALKNMLLTFQQSTGLKVNFAKSSMIPLNMTDEEAARLAAILGCKIGQFPFTYLGLPLGTTRPRIIDLMPLVDSLERRLTASSSMLNQGSRLQLLTSVPTSLPIYFLCSLNIPAGIVKQLDRIFRQCLWRGNSDAPKQSLAAWELVCRPRDKGGLSIINLNIQNKGLLIKHLHKFYNKVDVPWVTLIWNIYYDHGVPQATAHAGSFWWRDVLKLHEAYTAIASAHINMGDSALFWTDSWHIGGSARPLCWRLPRLFSFVNNDRISVQEFLQSQDLYSMFYLPLSHEAAAELHMLEGWIMQLDRDPAIPDSKCTMKIKVFGWLLFFDRLNTKDMLL